VKLNYVKNNQEGFKQKMTYRTVCVDYRIRFLKWKSSKLHEKSDRYTIFKEKQAVKMINSHESFKCEFHKRCIPIIY